MSTTESTRSMTEPEIEIEPFVIDLDSPYSTPPSSPTVSYHEFEPSLDHVLDEPPDCTFPDFLSDTDGESLLDFLYSPTPPSLGLYETLLADPSPASRAAILYYLTLAPVLQHNISTLVPPLLDDSRVMVGIATNIGFFNALGYISESELEYLLMAILTCKNPDKKNPDKKVSDDKSQDGKGLKEATRFINDPDPRILNLYHMTHTQIRLHRTALAPKHILRMQHQHQRSREYHKKLHTKWWQRTAEIACLSLPPSDHLRSSVPLPYGCATNAQLFADVNEMYTLETPPCKDWAQTRGVCPVYYKNPDGRAPRVKLPGRGKDKRKLQEPGSGSKVTIQEELMFSVSRIWAEELFACEERREGLRVKTPGVDN